MTSDELKAFQDRHALSNKDLGDLIGVSALAVHHWRVGRRNVSLVVSRLLRLFDREPDVMGRYVAT